MNNSTTAAENGAGVAVLSSDDMFAGISLVFLGALGIILHAIELAGMRQLCQKFIGFRLITCLAPADVLCLVQFGVWPGLVILLRTTILPAKWKLPIHAYLDIVWFAMCYVNVLIALSRFACIAYPMRFNNLSRTLTSRQFYAICVIPWLIAAAQTIIVHMFGWFEPLYYSTDVYGMTGNWTRYAAGGTQSYYLTVNGIVMGSYVLVYFTTAIVMLTRRKGIVKIFSTESANKNASNTAQAVEIKLMIPCVASAVVFIAGQFMIIGGVGNGKWVGYAVVVIFCLLSILPPIFRFASSSLLRKHVLRALLNSKAPSQTTLFVVSVKPKTKMATTC